MPVTLQISLAPSDFAHAEHILPHQVRTWRGQCAELLLTIDFHRSRGRFADDWDAGRERIVSLANSIPDARVVHVDYSPDAHRKVSTEFFGGLRVPAKDFRGGPYYSYFFGLAQAQHDHVFHLDSDLLFGGGSPTWMAEALEHMSQNRELMFAAPLPGPPRADGRLLTLAAERDSTPGAFRFDGMSTRLFLISRRRFKERIGLLRTRPPQAMRNRVIALLEGNPSQDLPEHILSDAMRAHGLIRRDLLGKPPGMWSLHPPYRCATFYANLPELIQRCERGDVPDSQRGCCDVNDEMVDWSEARLNLARNRLWRRLLKRQ